MTRDQHPPIEADACPGCGSLSPEHDEPLCLADACPGCLRADGDHDDDCPLVWWFTWDEHQDGAPPIEPIGEEDG